MNIQDIRIANVYQEIEVTGEICSISKPEDKIREILFECPRCKVVIPKIPCFKQL
jgi:hypothetical protein